MRLRVQSNAGGSERVTMLTYSQRIRITATLVQSRLCLTHDSSDPSENLSSEQIEEAIDVVRNDLDIGYMNSMQFRVDVQGEVQCRWGIEE